MVDRKYIVGLLMFSLLILAGFIVKLVINSAVELPNSNAINDATKRVNGSQDDLMVSTPSGGFMPTKIISSTNTTEPRISLSAQTNNIVFYVSKAGNNVDGKSWNTAWNELDQIQWKDVKPGDTIMLSGGEFHTSMDVGTSGAFGSPITITTNGEKVILDGQRPAPPYCGESEYIPAMGKDAIDLEGRSFIVLDGQEWKGIVIRNYKRGIMMRERTSNIIVRNVEIYDNGWSSGSGANIWPDGPGVELGGSDILFERVIVHDNGQDAFQAGWGVWNFTLRNSWLYNSREHPIVHGQPFNYCSHSDGIQIYDGGVQGPVVIEKSIIGPSFQQDIMINNKAAVNNVLIEDTLFVGRANGAIAIQNGGESSNWMLQNVTIVQDTVYESWNVKMNGNGHRIRNSMFWGGPWGIGIFNWSEAIGNYNWLTPDRYNVALEMNPMFVDDDYSGVQGAGFAEFNFTVQNPSIPSGTGSSITSVKQLFEP
jgi:hypothetical protein